VIELATLKTYDEEYHRAGVQLMGSLTTYLDHIPVSVAIAPSAMVVGNKVLVAIPEGNVKDAVVIATWPQGSLPPPQPHASTHEETGSDPLKKMFLPYQIYRRLGRFFHIQFDSYEMIVTYTTGSGYIDKLFLGAVPKTGTTANSIAMAYQNRAMMYAKAGPGTGITEAMFAQAAALNPSTGVKAVGFLGMALKDNTFIELDSTSKHAGFVFVVDDSGATVYAQNADGTNVTKTNLNCSTGYATWSMEMLSTGVTNYYRSWVLKASHDTNLPTGLLTWKVCVKNIDAANIELSTRNFVFAF